MGSSTQGRLWIDIVVFDPSIAITLVQISSRQGLSRYDTLGVSSFDLQTCPFVFNNNGTQLLTQQTRNPTT